MTSTAFVVGFVALCLHGATAGGPYITGSQAQKPNFTGQDGER